MTLCYNATILYILYIIGLRKIHYFTKTASVPIRFIATTWNNTVHTIQYNKFHILNSSFNYQLKIEDFNSSASINAQQLRQSVT